MANHFKNQKEILSKLKIEQLNQMQEEALKKISSSRDTLLLSPTGSGKTLAFLLPLINGFDTDFVGVQALIIVPTRELAIQIEQVFRTMGTGFKSTAAYGGQSFSTDRINLQHPPTLLIGTPGRISDHIRRHTFDTSTVKKLVLDEFDKSLEIGFEKEMKYILYELRQVNQKILTSATDAVAIPSFIRLNRVLHIDYLEDKIEQLDIHIVWTPTKDKLDALVKLLRHLGKQPGIVFCNYKDSIQRISEYLTENGIPHGCFYGGMEQQDRERALVKCRNGSHQLIIATDLAARGIDIPEIKFIAHYHLPIRAEEFTHRNGRTARMNKAGKAYVLIYEKEGVPGFIQKDREAPLYTDKLVPHPEQAQREWTTLLISGGRSDKISKGDIVGLFLQQGELDKEDLGLIELQQTYAFVGVKADKANDLIAKINNAKLKKRKIRVKEV